MTRESYGEQMYHREQSKIVAGLEARLRAGETVPYIDLDGLGDDYLDDLRRTCDEVPGEGYIRARAQEPKS